MSSAEPFMPAHEPPPPKPDTDRDIDTDVDVFPGDAGKEVPDGPAVHPEAPLPPFRRPVAGAHLTHDQLAEELGADETGAEQPE
ncbi:hypothetical protein ACH3VR_10705 [Microbacterium sp. B2969]|uniref:Uncharacterized protein n=1 Tax=Microbacterium alkaliflavum TaxID=3248839 RepID=A0ABW7Q7I1_9MICO